MYYGDVSIHDLFKGQGVTFLGRGGYDSDEIFAFRSGLRVGEVYQVTGFEIGGWRSEITLEGFGKVKFNSVMFGYDDVAPIVKRAWLNNGEQWGIVNQAEWIAMLDAAKKELDLYEAVGLDSNHIGSLADDFFDKIDATSWQKVMFDLNSVSVSPSISVSWSDPDSLKE